MIKFSSMLFAQFLILSTELNAYSRSSLWKPKSGTLTDTTELFLVVCCFSFFYGLVLCTYCPIFRCLVLVSHPVRPLSIFTLLLLSRRTVYYFMRALSHKRRVCAVLFLSTPLKYAGFVIFRNVFVCVLCLTNIGFVECIFPRLPLVCRLCYIKYCSWMRALPHNHRVCAVLFPQLLLFADLIMFCTIQWCFCQRCFVSRIPSSCSTIPLARCNCYTLVFLVCTIQ